MAASSASGWVSGAEPSRLRSRRSHTPTGSAWCSESHAHHASRDGNDTTGGSALGMWGRLVAGVGPAQAEDDDHGDEDDPQRRPDRHHHPAPVRHVRPVHMDILTPRSPNRIGAGPGTAYTPICRYFVAAGDDGTTPRPHVGRI